MNTTSEARNEWLYDPSTDSWFNPASDTVILAEDMPIELIMIPERTQSAGIREV